MGKMYNIFFILVLIQWRKISTMTLSIDKTRNEKEWQKFKNIESVLGLFDKVVNMESVM